MNRKALLVYLTVPLAAGLVAYVVTARPVQDLCATMLQGKKPPAVAYPTRLDLGEHEEGEVVVARFEIANHGGSELLLDRIRSNCSCSGLERHEGGRFIAVDTLRLAPGEKADLALRVSVRGVPLGAMMVNSLEFRTNDPIQPQCRIEAMVRRVNGGATIHPEKLCFGTVPVGAEVRQVIEVFDRSLSPRSLLRVASRMPDRIQVRVLPLKSDLPDPGANRDARPIGRLEVVVDTSKPASVDSAIEVYLSDVHRRPDVFPVFGRVQAPVELVPDSLFLPRASSLGSLYTGQIVCRANGGIASRLRVCSGWLGVRVEVAETTRASAWTVNVTIDRQLFPEDKLGQRLPIRLAALLGDKEEELELGLFVEK